MLAQNHIVQEADADSTGRCRDCDELVGNKHYSDCSIPQRSVVMRFSVEIVMAIPEREEGEKAAIRYTQGGWCGDNLIPMLADLADRAGCLCPHFFAEFVREATHLDQEGQAFTFTRKPPTPPVVEGDEWKSA